MDTTGRDQDLEARERIIDTATRLFAALGYDATTMTAIVDATGFDAPTITTVAGDKPTLYRSVIDRVHTRQRAMLDAAIADFTPDRAGMHGLMDRLLDHCVAHPELPALWMHRWQSDAADIPELESVYLQPDFDRLRTLVRKLAPAETDMDLALLTLFWSIRGFCVGGVLTGEGKREGQENPVLLDRFRRHLHRITDQIFDLNP